MGIPKLGKSQKGKQMHYSVGALIKKGDRYLLIDRAKPPFGFAGISGHIDEGENAVQALIREVKEESGLKLKEYKLLFEEELDWNWCSRGIKVHYWYLFNCNVSGKIKKNNTETKSIGWYSGNEIKKSNLKQKLEPAWEYWLKKTGVI